MAEQKESSVLFSLQELMGLEQDRIKQEENERQRKSDEESASRAASERRAREEEEARIRAEEERVRLEAARSREEAARLEAMRQAEVAKAQAEAENAARITAMRAQQDHEQKLAALSQDKKKAQLTYGIVGAIALIVLGGGGAGFMIHKKNQDADAAAAIAKATEEENKKKIDDLNAQIKKNQDEQDALRKELAGAKTDADKAAIQAKIDAKNAEASKLTGKPFTGGPAVKPTGATKPGKACPPGDPMCE